MNKEAIRKQLMSILENGEKSSEDVKLGIEIEHLVVQQKDFASVTYYETLGIETILKKLEKKGYQGKYEGDYLVGLSKESMDITLEPGGQLEFSTRPCIHLPHIEEVYEKFLADVLPIIEEHQQYLLCVGYHPQTKIKDIPFNPKKRYEYMSQYLQKTGKYALNMMKGTASVQVAIDYVSEMDFIKKFRVASFLIPLFYMITENAPIFEGEVYEKFSVRSLIWENTDPDRSGIIKGSLDKKFNYQDYAEYLLHSKPICILENGELKPTGDQSLWKAYKEREDLSKEEMEHLYTMVFPDVRGKNYIEIRMADSIPADLSMAYLAMVKGLFYDRDNLEELYNISLEYGDREIEALKEDLIDRGFQAPFRGEDLGAFGEKVILMAEEALENEERSMIEPLKELVFNRETYGQRIKRSYKKDGIEGLLGLRVIKNS